MRSGELDRLHRRASAQIPQLQEIGPRKFSYPQAFENSTNRKIIPRHPGPATSAADPASNARTKR
jgi:hypothetical protein